MFKEMRNKYKELPLAVKASFWFLICSFIQKGIQVITTPIFTRIMPTAEFGKYNVFNSWLSIFTIFVSLNLSGGIFSQGLVKYEDDRRNYSFSMQILNLILVIIALGVLLLFFSLGFVSKFQIIMMLFMLAIIWSNAVFNLWATEQRVNYKYRNIVALTIFSSIIIPFTSILLIKLKLGGAFSRILSAAFWGSLLYGFIFIKQLNNGKRDYKKYWKHTFTMAIPLLPHYLSQTILNSSDRIMIEKMVGLSEAGIYSLAYSLSSIMILFNTALVQTLTPYIFKKIKEKKIEVISKVTFPALIFVAGVNILLMAFAPEVVAIFAPSEYSNAIWIIPPVAMSVYFMFAYDLFVKFEFYYERTKLISTATFIGAGINLILNFICIKKFGYMAAGYTTLICFIIYAVFHYVFMQKICNKELNGVKPFNLKTLLIITLVFLGFGFAILAMYNYFAIRYAFILLILIILICNFKKIIAEAKTILDLRK